LYNSANTAGAPAQTVPTAPRPFGQAVSLYRRHFGALVLIGALAIAPASLLEGGALHAVMPRLSHEGDAHPPKPAPARSDAARVQQQLGTRTVEPVRPSDALRAALPFLYETFIGVFLLAAGAWLAFAAICAAVFAGNFSAPHAWAGAFRRIGPLVWTISLTGAIIGLGSLCFLIPGAVMAVGLAFSIPAVMEERLSGMAALHRSWRLVRATWPSVLGLLLLLAAFSAAASATAMLTPPGPLRLLIATAIRAICWPLPLVGLALSYKATRARA
jgi:hypothetical protein